MENAELALLFEKKQISEVKKLYELFCNVN